MNTHTNYIYVSSTNIFTGWRFEVVYGR